MAGTKGNIVRTTPINSIRVRFKSEAGVVLTQEVDMVTVYDDLDDLIQHTLLEIVETEGEPRTQPWIVNTVADELEVLTLFMTRKELRSQIHFQLVLLAHIDCVQKTPWQKIAPLDWSP